MNLPHTSETLDWEKPHQFLKAIPWFRIPECLIMHLKSGIVQVCSSLMVKKTWISILTGKDKFRGECLGRSWLADAVTSVYSFVVLSYGVEYEGSIGKHSHPKTNEHIPVNSKAQVRNPVWWKSSKYFQISSPKMLHVESALLVSHV